MADGTIVDIISAESGGLEMTESFVGQLTTVVSSPAPASSKETYLFKMDHGGVPGRNLINSPKLHSNTSTPWWTMGFKIRFSTTSTAPDYRICDSLSPGEGAADWTLLRDNFTGLRLNDRVGTLISTEAADVFVAGQEHNVEIKWQKKDSTDVKVYVDNVLVISSTGEDLNRGGTTVKPHFHFDAPGASVIDQWFGTIYLKTSDGTKAIDFDETVLGNWSSHGPGWGYKVDVGSPDTLAAGALENTDDVPAVADTISTDGARYTVADSGESPKEGIYAVNGPNGQSIDEIVGGAWVYLYQTYGTNKFGQDRPVFEPVYGSHANASTDGTVTEDSGIQGLGKRNLVIVQDKTGSEMPTADEWAQFGYAALWVPFGLVGNVDLWDAWFVVLDKEAAVTGRIMSSLAAGGGLAGSGGIAGRGGGLAS